MVGGTGLNQIVIHYNISRALFISLLSISQKLVYTFSVYFQSRHKHHYYILMNFGKRGLVNDKNFFTGN